LAVELWNDWDAIFRVLDTYRQGYIVQTNT
jgi:hypothetical protein